MNNYKEDEVLDIIKSCTDEDSEKILLNWNRKKANTPLKLEKGSYPQFVYSFPLLVNAEKVATITLAALYGYHEEVDNLMIKYLGYNDYIESWDTFSHDTYLYCYLTIHKENFELPEIVKGYHSIKAKAVDAKGIEFDFTFSYGYPENEEDTHLWHADADKGYRFDRDIVVIVDKMENGWFLGEKINENIEKRLSNEKIEE